MNNLTIIGNLTNDPVSRTTPKGDQVCTFTVAVNRGNQEADFFRVSAWRKLAEVCTLHLSKGRKVAVTGSVGVSTYKDKNGEFRASLEVTAGNVEFLSPKYETTAVEPIKPVERTGFVEVQEELPF